MRIYFLPLLFFMWALQVQAEPLAPANIAELIDVGIEQNLNLQVIELTAPLAEEDVRINEAFFDPELFSSVGYSQYSLPLDSSFSLNDSSDAETLSGQVGMRKRFFSGLSASLSLDSEWNESNDSNNNLDPTYQTSLNLNLSQPLLKNFGADINRTQLSISSNTKRQASLSHQLQAQALALELEMITSQFAGESRIVDLRSRAVKLADELLKANRKRFDIGVIPISEVQEAETARANRELSLSLANQSQEQNFEQLDRLLNHSLAPHFDARKLYPFESRLELVDVASFDEMYAEAKARNLNLKIAAVTIENSDLQKKFFSNQLKPSLDLVMNFGVNGLAGDDRTPAVASRYAGSWSDSVVSAAERDGYQWGAALEFSLPLGNRSAKASFRKAELQRKQAQLEQRDQESELMGNLRNYGKNLQRAKEQVVLAEKFERLAQVSLQQEQRRLEEGLSDTFRILSFQDNMINAQIGRIAALVKYHQAVALLNYTRGIILEQHNLIVQQSLEEKAID